MAVAADGGLVGTVNGSPLAVSLLDSDLMFDDAKVIIKNVPASNGIIHAIDKVIIPPENIVEVAISSDPEFTTLVQAIVAAGLTDDLKKGSITVFAPTNAAFEKLGMDTVTELLEKPKELAQILKYHVVKGTVSKNNALALVGKSVPTLSGESIAISLSNSNELKINNAKVVTANVPASNGVIHVID